MCLILLRHGQDRYHGNRTVVAFLTSGSLIHRRKVCIKVSRIASSARNLFSRRGNFAESLGVVSDVGQNYQHVHTQVESQIFGGGQRHTRRRDTLYRRVVGQIHEEDCSVYGSRSSEIRSEKFGFFVGYTYGGKYYGEVSLVASYLGLTGYLGGQIRVRQTGS